MKQIYMTAVPYLLLAFSGCFLIQTAVQAGVVSPEAAAVASIHQENSQADATGTAEVAQPAPGSIFPAVVAKVDGESIFGRNLEILVRRELAPIGNPEWKDLREDYRGQLTLAALNILINSELVYREAIASGMAATDEEVKAEIKKISDSFGSDAEMNAALAEQMMDRESLEEDLYRRLAANKYVENKIVKNIVVTPEEVAKYYAENPNEFQHPDMVRTSHILILSGETSAQNTLAKQRAESLLERVKKGEDFAKLAKEHSMDPSASRGGDIGYNTKEQLTPEFGEAAYSLAVGDAKLIKSQYGYHIVKVTDKKEAGMSTLEEINDQLKAFLVNQKSQAEQAKLINQLREKSNIEILIPAGQPLTP